MKPVPIFFLLSFKNPEKNNVLFQKEKDAPITEKRYTSHSSLPKSDLRLYCAGIPTDSSRLITAMAVAQDSHLISLTAINTFILFQGTL